LDGWRGVAILMVLLGHFVGLFGVMAPVGVEIFFVLSGRLMGQILFVDNSPLRQFFPRRIIRILPALYCYLLAVATLMVVQHILRLRQETPIATVGGLISAMTMTFNYWLVTVGHSSVLDHLWSLCVEEHSYIVLGLIALCGRKSLFSPRIAISVITILAIFNGAFETLLIGDGGETLYWRSDVRIAASS
jgi:peptidoglycan/LPS O-acetylase OafA/YrhL